MISPRMSYASTRVQSRFGALPDSQVWLSLSNAQNMAQFLQIAGTSDMALWVRKLGPESSVHA
ncbi:MAG: hypothetical protein OEZ23_06960, partial [Gammaproteobacteria bacterium]|nr:hypothetical protein [Gammaproteobacteria bacterium]